MRTEKPALPLYYDSGATCHISPECSDFKTFHPINSHPITELGGACVYAVGISTVELLVDSGHIMKLHNVLYVPTVTVRLVCIVTLNCNGHHYTIFRPDDVWLTDSNSAIFAHGVISSTQNLFTLTTPNPHIASNASLHSTILEINFSTSCTPNIKTWHCQLAHCSTRTIVNMAHNGIV